MATEKSSVDDLLERLTPVGRVTAKKMFGEYCLYLDDKPIALICENKLFLKVTASGRELVPDAAEESPYPGAKPHIVLRPDQWDNRELLYRIVRATYEELPQPKPQKKKT